LEEGGTAKLNFGKQTPVQLTMLSYNNPHVHGADLPFTGHDAP
jgi:hypothetical protein